MQLLLNTYHVFMGRGKNKEHEHFFRLVGRCFCPPFLNVSIYGFSRHWSPTGHGIIHLYIDEKVYFRTSQVILIQ